MKCFDIIFVWSMLYLIRGSGAIFCQTEEAQPPLQLSEHLALLAGDVVSFRTVCSLHHSYMTHFLKYITHVLTRDASSHTERH